MAIYKRLRDYTIRGGTGGYHVEGMDPRITVGQANAMGTVRGTRPGGFIDDSQVRALEDRISQARDKEIATNMALRAAEVKAEQDALKQDVDALAALWKEAPTDKLGNKVATPEIEALRKRVLGRMQGYVGPIGLEEEYARGNIKKFEVDQPPAPAVKPPAPQQPSNEPRRIVQPTPGQSVTHNKSGAEAVMTGLSRQGPNGMEVQVKLPDGRLLFVAQKDISYSEAKADAGFDLREYFRKKQEAADRESYLGSAEAQMIP